MLVSLLEADNEFYNTGIVDVSYRFDKMYVIRPQFFIPIITLLRNASLNSLKYKAELNLVKSQNIDITNFEDKINGIFIDNNASRIAILVCVYAAGLIIIKSKPTAF